MVRLKAIKSSTKWYVYLISIPYGSIKSFDGSFGYDVWSLFQFLMVRLKAYRILMHCVVTAFQFLMVRLKAKEQSTLQSLVTFQFLMVRLKETNSRCLKANTHISIPYGSIKRQRNRKR